MSDAAVTFLLEQVIGVIKGYVDLISGAEQEFENLKEDVEDLKNILKDTAHKSNEDNTTRSTRSKIRAVVYEVEDAIDTWLTESKAAKKSRFHKSYNVAKQVKMLRENKLKDILLKAKEMKRDLAFVGPSKGEEAQEREDPPIRREKVVGLKDEEETITGYLRKEQKRLDIIPVIGMPGLGKTTLTWKIYNDEKTCYDFPIRIWVQFSERFNRKDVLIQILKIFIPNTEVLYSMKDRDLCNEVHKFLSTENFLLVVDDVWKTEHWDAIKEALPYSNGKGKVLITSREMDVGRHVKQITEPHQQRKLNPEESWELLQLEVFGEIGSCPEKLKGIGKVIANNCGGVPLTIVVIGGVLKDQYLKSISDVLVKEKWEEVAKNVDLALDDKKKVILDVVELSYKRLPDRLRDCFLYLGVFPAGYDIQTWTLTRLWIAEGFIQPDEKRSLEKIAEDNVNDLISRNLLMVNKMNPMQEVKVCRVHDMIRMFCTEQSKKQDLFKEVRMSEGQNSGLATDMQKIHRLCLHSELDRFFSTKLKGPHVRSFLCFLKDTIDLKPENISAIYENFVSLRILQTKSIKFKKFNPKITKLIHLRYIVLCIPELDTLPEPISDLWNLQTIIVDTNFESLKMRASLWKMIRLRHFKTKAAIVLEKSPGQGDEAGDNLQTLNRLSPESVKAVSQRATDLKTLGVRGKLTPLFNDMPLGNMYRLEKLKLHHAGSGNELKHFPDSNRFPPNLRRLTLSKTFLDWKQMSKLAMIPCLEVLKLKENAFVGITWEAKTQTFGKLQVLHILNSDLSIWEVSDSTFPVLRHLELKNCEKLTGIPDGTLGRLEKLDIGRVSKSIAASAKKLALQPVAESAKKLQLKLGAEFI